jgi:Ca-activated chloride channel family protein
VSFEYPVALLTLAFVPLSGLIYLAAQRRRRRYAVRFTNMDLLADVVTQTPSWRRHIPPLLYLLALAALALAIARPHELVNVAKREATVILVTDSSGSMQATDVKPSRLAAAQTAAKGFVDDTPKKVKLGFISFNSASQLLVPPTSDKNRVKGAVETLRPVGGTAIGSALETSLAALQPVLKDSTTKKGSSAKDKKRAPPAVVVLLSDGYSTTGPPPLQAAQHAKKLNVPVYTVALGTESAVVQVADPVGGYRTVQVPPDRKTLKQVADTTGGKFFATADSKKLSEIYKSLGTRIGFRKERHELTAAFAAGGLALMMLGGAFSLLWFGRLP